MKDQDDRLLTPAQAATYLNIGRSTMYRLIAVGAIAHVKVGPLVRISREDLDRFVERSRVPTLAI